MRRGSRERAEPSFKIRVSQTSRYYLDDIRPTIGSETTCFQSIIAGARARGKLSFICVNGLLLQRQRLCGPAMKAGWRSSGWPSLRSPQRRKIIQSRLHSFREKRRAGAPPSRARKRSGSCLDQLQTLKRISLVFEEKETGRTQEFVLQKELPAREFS